VQSWKEQLGRVSEVKPIDTLSSRRQRLHDGSLSCQRSQMRHSRLRHLLSPRFSLNCACYDGYLIARVRGEVHLVSSVFISSSSMIGARSNPYQRRHLQLYPARQARLISQLASDATTHTPHTHKRNPSPSYVMHAQPHSTSSPPAPWYRPPQSNYTSTTSPGESGISYPSSNPNYVVDSNFPSRNSYQMSRFETSAHTRFLTFVVCRYVSIE